MVGPGPRLLRCEDAMRGCRDDVRPMLEGIRERGRIGERTACAEVAERWDGEEKDWD